MKTNIAIIGAGNMGSAILTGIHNDYKVYVHELDLKRAKALKAKYKNIVMANLSDAIKAANAIILAVKPQDFDAILQSIKPFANKSKLVISIAAGIKCSYIEKRLSAGARVVRTMPNLPAQCQQGMTALCAGKHATKNDLALVYRIFEKVGKSVVVAEKDMDAVTAVSGSGPAYVFYFTEIFSKAAQAVGLDREISDQLIAQTLKGSLALLERSGESAEVLRTRVTSKGGTTQAALEVFMRNKTDKIFTQALKAAKNRAKELSR